MRKVIILLIMLITMASSASAIDTSSLYAYFSFDTNIIFEDVNDTTAYAFVAGNPVNQTTGCKVGAGCYEGDGTGDAVDISLLNASVMGSSEGTMCGWLYADINSTDVAWGIEDENLAADSSMYVIRTSTAYIQNVFVNASYGAITTNTSPVLPNTATWTFICSVWGTNVALYVNGVHLDGIGTNIMPLDTSIDPFNIGAGEGYASSWDGKLDEISIWTSALSAADILELYNSGSGFNPLTLTAPVVGTPVWNNTITYSGDDIGCGFNATDANGDNFNVSANLFINDTIYNETQTFLNVPNGTETFLNWTASNYSTGDVIICEAWAYDSYANSTLMNSSATTIQGVLSLGINSPDNDTYSNSTLVADFNYSNGGGYTGNCSLYVNTSIAQTYNEITTGTTNFQLNDTTIEEGTSFWYIYCIDSALNTENTTERTFTYDNTLPVIDSNLAGNATVRYNASLELSINFTDENLFFVNVSDGIYEWYIEDVNETVYNHSEVVFIENQTIGVHEMVITACDGHTTNEIGNWNNNINGAKIEFYDGKYSIALKDANDFKSANITKEVDKYTFTFNTLNISKTEKTFVVESDYPITIVSKTKYKGHLIIMDLRKWIDFEEVGGGDVSIKKIKDNIVEVTVASNKKELQFKSTGDLNCVTETNLYYNGNYTSGHVATAVEGTSGIFWMAVSYNSTFITEINVSTEIAGDGFFYNFTTYNATKHEYYDAINFTQNITFGEGDGTFDSEFNWTILLPDGSTLHGETGILQTVVSGIVLDECNASNVDGAVINVSIYEESNLTLLDANINIFFQYYIGESYNIANLSFTGVNNTAVCIDPTWANFTGNLTMVYTNETGFDEKTYYILQNEFYNESLNISLYLAMDADTKDVYTLVYDEQYREIEDVIVKVQRYYPNEAVFRTVQEAKTGWDGYTILNLVENTTDYKFTFTKDGTTRLITSPMRVLCTQASTYPCAITFNLEGTVTDFFDYYEGFNVSYVWGWNNETKVLSFTFDDATGVTQSMILEVYRETLNGRSYICNTTLETASGTITCNASAYTTGEIFAQAYRTASPKEWVTYYSVQIQEWWRLMGENGQEGLFWAAILLITVGMTAVYSATGAVVLTTFGFVGLYFLGITSIDIMLLMTFICLAATVIIVLIRRKLGGES